MKQNTSHYCELERLLRELLATVASDLSDQDRNDVHEYLEHGEYGVAYELTVIHHRPARWNARIDNIEEIHVEQGRTSVRI